VWKNVENSAPVSVAQGLTRRLFAYRRSSVSAPWLVFCKAPDCKKASYALLDFFSKQAIVVRSGQRGN
jgi:hypothetical protein